MSDLFELAQFALSAYGAAILFIQIHTRVYRMIHGVSPCNAKPILRGHK